VVGGSPDRWNSGCDCADLKLADQLINLAMKIVTFPADFHALLQSWK
jgi:hypothetical protein